MLAKLKKNRRKGDQEIQQKKKHFFLEGKGTKQFNNLSLISVLFLVLATPSIQFLVFSSQTRSSNKMPFKLNYLIVVNVFKNRKSEN